MLLHVGPLPAEALAASAQFHADVLPRVAAALGGGASLVTLVFTAAGHEHRAWRTAAVQTLARTYAPARINAVSSDDQAAVAAAHAWLEIAPGLTGHYLILDGNGAGAVV